MNPEFYPERIVTKRLEIYMDEIVKFRVGRMDRGQLTCQTHPLPAFRTVDTAQRGSPWWMNFGYEVRSEGEVTRGNWRKLSAV